MRCHIRYPCGNNGSQGLSQTVGSFILSCIINGKGCAGQFRCTVDCLLRKHYRICRNRFVIHIQYSSLGDISGINKCCLNIVYKPALFIYGVECTLLVNGEQDRLCQLIAAGSRLLNHYIGDTCNKLITTLERLSNISRRSPCHDRRTAGLALIILDLIIRQRVNCQFCTCQHCIALCDLAESVINGRGTIVYCNLCLGFLVTGTIQRNTRKGVYCFGTVHTIIDSVCAVGTSFKRYTSIRAFQNIVRTEFRRSIGFRGKIHKSNRWVILCYGLDIISDATIQFQYIALKRKDADIEGIIPVFRNFTVYSDLLSDCDLAVNVLNNFAVENRGFCLCILGRCWFIDKSNRVVDIIGLICIVIVLRIVVVLNDVIIVHIGTVHNRLVGTVHFKDIVINACR